MTNKIIKQKFEKALLRVLKIARKSAYEILNESNLKCFLFAELSKEAIFRKKFLTKEHYKLNILHTEYWHWRKTGRGLHDLVILDKDRIRNVACVGNACGDYVDKKPVLIGCELKVKYYLRLPRDLYYIITKMKDDSSAFVPKTGREGENAKYGYVVFVNQAEKRNDETKIKLLREKLEKLQSTRKKVKFNYLELPEKNTKNDSTLITVPDK